MELIIAGLNVCVSTSLAAFKVALKTVQLDNECCSFLDQC